METDNRLAKKLLFNGAPIKVSQYFGVLPRKGTMAKESLIRANPKWNDGSRLRKMPMDAIDHAGPRLVETIIQNDDAALRQCAFTSGKIMRGNVSRMSAIDADDAQRASTKLEQITRCELSRVTFMNDKPVAICMPAKVLLKTLKVARAGVIGVQLLMGEQVDCNCRFVIRPKEI
ncbi:MAG: hypothetical protein ABI177_10660 [Edaphobacter sp.]